MEQNSNTWHERIPTFEEERRYGCLLGLHGMTQQWLKELAPNEDSNDLYRMQRLTKPELAQNLWLLEKLRIDRLPPKLIEVVDGTSVQQFLDELEETIWIVQLSTLENALENSKDREGLLSSLDRLTWAYAKSVAEKDWPNFSETSPYRCFQVLETSPFCSKKPFLLESYNEQECSFYWLTPPVSRKSLQRSKYLAELSALQIEFFRGYVYGLTRSIRVETAPAVLGELQTFRVRFLNVGT